MVYESLNLPWTLDTNLVNSKDLYLTYEGLLSEKQICLIYVQEIDSCLNDVLERIENQNPV